MKAIRIAFLKLATDKKWLTMSNQLTLLRLLLAPVIVITLAYEQWIGAVALFVFAALTDLLDGYLARARNEQTHLGTLLDPLADKCLLISVFGALFFFDSPFFHIPRWFFMVVFLRELIMLLGAIVMLRFFKHVHVEPMIWGKMTTLCQILFLLWIFVCYFAGWEPQRTFMVLLIALTLFSCISFAKYAQRAWRELDGF